MELILKQIGNSVGVTLPKEELDKRGLVKGSKISIVIQDDPLWSELEMFTREDRAKANTEDNLSDDDMAEWESL